MNNSSKIPKMYKLDLFGNPIKPKGNAINRLPFGLCKKYGIEIGENWTPKDAWKALKSKGINPKTEYAKLDNKNAEQDSENDLEHKPDYNHAHRKGHIAGARRGEPMTFEEADSGNCNPYFGDKTLSKDIAEGYQRNCQTCVAVYWARRQGYDVRALPNFNNKNIKDLAKDISLAYVNSNGCHPFRVFKDNDESLNDFFAWRIPGTYVIQFGWRNKPHGHVIIMEKDTDDNLTLYDPQSNEIIPKEDIQNYFKRAEGICAMGLSNYCIDEEFCDKIMKKASNKGDIIK